MALMKMTAIVEMRGTKAMVIFGSLLAAAMSVSFRLVSVSSNVVW